MKRYLENKAYDVAVCGGGFGGISAALAAAREGARVVLFEKEYMLGGLGTAGLVTIYLPLCDGLGHQVSFGIAEELFRLSIKHGADGRYPANWLDGVGTKTEKDPRFEVIYNPQVFAILAEQLLLSEGVDIMYGSYVVDTAVEDGKIKSLAVENKSGCTKYFIKSVVDATGDCDIAHFADAACETYQRGNVLAAWHYFADPEGYHLRMHGYADIPEEELEGREQTHLIDRRFSGLCGKELSEMMALSHEQVLNAFLEQRQKDSSVSLATIATIPQIRMTRKIAGTYQLAYAEMHTRFEDSIGCVSNWKKRGPAWEIPFGTLVSPQIKNLFVAGRCTSVDERLWDVMRVIPCCAVTGQAAGTAAAMTDDISKLNIAKLQNALVENGVMLHLSDVIS